MIYDATVCKLGEGPLWHPERQELFWFDILGKRLHRKGQHWQFDRHVSAVGWVDESTLLIASDRDLFRFDIETGTETLLVPLEADMPVTRSNDGRADPQGGFWIGTMGLNAEDGAGAIYRYYRGELRKLFAPMQITNAICFAPAGDTAYFTDTNTQVIKAVTLDADGWPEGEPRVHIDLTGTDFRPDGAVVDESGHLWSAQWGVGRVARYDRDGKEVEAIDLPASQTSCPAFGGPDLSTLYVTSASVGLGQDAQEDGKVFEIETQTKGQREHRVIM
jgi:sugar lactone lactonase YvrE